MKIYVKASADSEARDLCKQAEKMIKDNLVSAGLKKKYLPMLSISVIPAGSGFRATVVLPQKAFHGAKESSFFYKRDLDKSIQNLCAWLIVNRGLIERQLELDKPNKPKSSTQIALSEARNSSDPDRLRELAKHNASSVRQAVAKNPNTPEDILFDLLLDGQDISIWRFESPEYKYKIFDLGNVDFCTSLAGYKKLPEDLYQKLFDFGVNNFNRSGYYGSGKLLLRKLASNPSTPIDIYYKLYDINDKDIDWSLACGAETSYNRCPTPKDIIDGLIERHPDWENKFKFTR